MSDSSFWTETRTKLAYELALAIECGDATTINRLCTSNPWLIRDYKWDDESTWIGDAVKEGDRKVVATMLDLGFNINALRMPEKSSVLFYAISYKHWDLVSFLLSKGADPNLDRPLLAAIDIKDPVSRLAMVKLLVERGAQVNRKYELYDDPENLATALDWAGSDTAVVTYLRSRGAKTLEELEAGGSRLS